MTALYVASKNGHVEVVNILLQNGAHVDVQDKVSLTFSPTTDRALKLYYISQEHLEHMLMHLTYLFLYMYRKEVSLTFHIRSTDRAVKLKAMYISQQHGYY